MNLVCPARHLPKQTEIYHVPIHGEWKLGKGAWWVSVLPGSSAPSTGQILSRPPHPPDCPSQKNLASDCFAPHSIQLIYQLIARYPSSRYPQTSTLPYHWRWSMPLKCKSSPAFPQLNRFMASVFIIHLYCCSDFVFCFLI